ncbi:MAG: MauE/DoxX family redox-associated membrane protein [Pseudomonadota bacterium]
MNRFIEWRGHSWLSLPMRLYLGFVFVTACLHKIAHPSMFALDVATYDILPLALINPMAIILPYLELLAGIMLLIGFRVRGSALAVFGMMLMFLVAVIIALAKGLDMSCGCFASQSMEEETISGLTMLRDLFWLLLSLYIVLFDRRPIGMDRLLAQRRSANA